MQDGSLYRETFRRKTLSLVVWRNGLKKTHTKYNNSNNENTWSINFKSYKLEKEIVVTGTVCIYRAKGPRNTVASLNFEEVTKSCQQIFFYSFQRLSCCGDLRCFIIIIKRKQKKKKRLFVLHWTISYTAGNRSNINWRLKKCFSGIYYVLILWAEK